MHGVKNSPPPGVKRSEVSHKPTPVEVKMEEPCEYDFVDGGTDAIWEGPSFRLGCPQLCVCGMHQNVRHVNQCKPVQFDLRLNWAMTKRVSNTYMALVEKWATVSETAVEKVPFWYMEPLPAGLLKEYTSGKGAIKLSLKAAAGELVPMGHFDVVEYAAPGSLVVEQTCDAFGGVFAVAGSGGGGGTNRCRVGMSATSGGRRNAVARMQCWMGSTGGVRSGSGTQAA